MDASSINQVGIELHSEFDWINASIGGLLIAIASSFYLIMTGRVSGLSSILEGFITVDLDTFRFKTAFLGGMMAAASVVTMTSGHKYISLHDTHLESLSIFQTVLSGFLVGAGTRLGNGCTSGHGVVGLSKRSPRSFVSVLVFLTTGMLSATIMGNIWGHASHEKNLQVHAELHVQQIALTFGMISLAYAIYDVPYLWADSVVSFITGGIFTAGLAISGMATPSKVVNFLKIDVFWDPSLMFVMGSAVLFNLVAFHFAHEYLHQPLLCKMFPAVEKKLIEDKKQCGSFETPVSYSIDVKLVAGAALFGIGWSITGLCPGPSILLIVSGNWQIITGYLPGLIVGMLSSVYIKGNLGKEYLIKPIVHKHSTKN